ncbi:hypothetical protein COOONC_23379 [Cooperia oncophora]
MELKSTVKSSAAVQCRVFPEFLSKKATESLRGFGVDVITNDEITAARKQGEQLEVQVNGSKPISSDYIIVCIGIQPDTAVAEASGLEVRLYFLNSCDSCCWS